MMPSLFLCHGSPGLALESNQYTRFLNHLFTNDNKPEAVVIFSAHWESDVMKITYTNEQYETIYDFYGFPPELYQMIYPAKGSVQIAEKALNLFLKEGFNAEKEEFRGLDHGVWVLLQQMFPDADIPVVVISVNPMLPLEEQYRIGQIVARLRENNILILGSGGTVHNLRRLERQSTEIHNWAMQFDDWLIEAIKKWDLPSLYAYRNQAPFAKEAVPTLEHFVPLFIAMGSGDGGRKANLLHRSYQFGSLSLIGWLFE